MGRHTFPDPPWIDGPPWVDDPDLPESDHVLCPGIEAHLAAISVDEDGGIDEYELTLHGPLVPTSLADVTWTSWSLLCDWLALANCRAAWTGAMIASGDDPTGMWDEGACLPADRIGGAR